MYVSFNHNFLKPLTCLQKPGILGESPHGSLQHNTMGMSNSPASQAGNQLLGEMSSGKFLVAVVLLKKLPICRV